MNLRGLLLGGMCRGGRGGPADVHGAGDPRHRGPGGREGTPSCPRHGPGVRRRGAGHRMGTHRGVPATGRFDEQRPDERVPDPDLARRAADPCRVRGGRGRSGRPCLQGTGRVSDGRPRARDRQRHLTSASNRGKRSSPVAVAPDGDGLERTVSSTCCAGPWISPAQRKGVPRASAGHAPC